MGFQSTHRQVREEVALELARAHRMDLLRVMGLLQHAERLLLLDPRKTIHECFGLVLARDAGEGHEAAPEQVPTPGRETLTMHLEDAAGTAAAPAAAARPEPLDSSVRARMEQAFGVGFTSVSIFRDSPLARGSTRALAKTDELHFRRGAYQPGTAAGDKLIAHELAHVVQQRGVTGARPAARPAIEREADRAASLVAQGRPAPIALRGAPGASYAYSDDADHDHAGHDHAEAPLEQDDTGTHMSRTWLDALASSTGRPLPANLRKRLEVALKADLGHVRVHDGAASEAAARKINANAFTLGKDIHFAPGKYDPASRKGQELIAHEVAHAVQGGHLADLAKPALSTPGDRSEREAEQFAADFVKQQADADVARARPAAPAAAAASGGPNGRGVVARGGVLPSHGLVAPGVGLLPGVSPGSMSRAVVHRDGGDGPAAPPAVKPKKPAPPAPKDPGIDEGELAKNKQDANNPEQDKKDKAKFEQDNPKAPKDPEPIKPVVKPPPAVQPPKPAAKKDAAPPPAKKGGKATSKPKAPPPASKMAAPAKPKTPAKKAPEAAVCAAVDGDVNKFWATAQKDPAANDISKRSSELWAAAQALSPAGESDDMIGALNPLTAFYNGDKKSDLGEAIAGFDQSKSPYAEFNEKYRTWAMTLATIRDVSYAMSNVLGKVGLAVTVVGFILTLFGVGAILVTIGRVLNIINMILDAVAAAAGIALAFVTAAQINAETDPYKKAKLAKLIMTDVNKAASNVVNFALATKGVGKIFGKIAKPIAKALGKIARPIANAIAKIYGKMKTFLEGVAKSKGIKGGVARGLLAAEKGAGRIANKAKANRAKALAEADAKQAKREQKDPNKAATKAKDRLDTRKDAQTDAQTKLDDAKQKQTAADSANAQAKTDAGDAQTKLDDAKQKAVTEKDNLTAAKDAEKQAKTDARDAAGEAKDAHKAQQKSEAAAKQTQDAEKLAQEQKATAERTAETARDQRAAAEAAEQRASEAAAAAETQQKIAADKAAEAKQAADEANALAGTDATGAREAAERAQKAAAEAQTAANKVTAAKQELEAANSAATAARDAETRLSQAKERAAQQVKDAETAKTNADQAAADAKAKAEKAQADFQKAQQEKANAEQLAQEQAKATTEKAKAESAQRAADQAAAAKTEADAAARRAQEEAKAAEEAKQAAEKAKVEKAKADVEAQKQREAAEQAKANADKAQREADAKAAESKQQAAAADKAKAEADAKVAADEKALAERKAALEKAEADKAVKAQQEARDKAALAEAEKRAEAAKQAKAAADTQLKNDKLDAEQKQKAADAAQADYRDKQQLTGDAKTAKANADKAAKAADKAARAADKAAKDADQAARDAADDTSAADQKKQRADDKVDAAEARKQDADADAAKAQKAADDADAHLKEAQEAQQKTKANPDDPKPYEDLKQPTDRPWDNQTSQGVVSQGLGYGTGQMQQELATKNDPRDQWGLNDWRLNSADDNPYNRSPRPYRMSELKASSPRAVNVSDTVQKIFARKKVEPQNEPQKPAQTQAPAPAPAASAQPAPEPAAKQDVNAALADVGPVPYWPELIQQYNFDLSAMSEARQQVQAYKAAQQKALGTAKGELKKKAAEIRAAEAARKPQLQENKTGLDKDKTNLDESKQGNQKQIDNDAKNDQGRDGAQGPAGEGADAAERAAAAEPPAPKSWWGRIKAAANWLLKNTLGKAMKFVTDAITNVVLAAINKSMGLDVKELANYGMTTADQGKAKAGEGTADTEKAGTDSSKVEADIAVEDMTLGQQIALGEKNVKDAEGFEKAIDEQEKALQAEIKACNDFVTQVQAAFDKCKADAEKEQAKPADAPKEEAAPPVNDAATPTPTDQESKDEGGENAELLKEAKGICTGSIDTEIAQLEALDAKGASLLMEAAGNDPGAHAEAERISQEIHNGVVKTAIDKLKALRDKTDAGTEDAIVAVAQDIDEECADGAAAIIDAYTKAEHDIIDRPPPPPKPAKHRPKHGAHP